MKKSFIMCFVFSFILFMSACAEEEAQVGEQEVESTDTEQSLIKDDEKEEEVLLLTDDEVKFIVLENLKQIDEVMYEIQDQYVVEWGAPEWINEPDIDSEKFNFAESIVKEKLSYLATENYLDERAHSYLIQFFTWLMKLSPYDQSFDVRFEVVEQTTEEFSVQGIELSNEAGYASPGTNIITYIKEDDVWKLHNYEFLNVEKQPLNLTLTDIEEYYAPNEIELIEELIVYGNTFIVTKNGEHIEARNTATSEFNFEILQNYETVSISTPSATTEGEKKEHLERVKVSSDYDKVVLEDISDWLNIEAEYPQFGHTEVDKIVQEHVEMKFKDIQSRNKPHLKEIEEGGIPFSFNYTIESALFTDEFVSIEFVDFGFEGGVHGNYIVKPLNLNLQTLKEIQIQDIVKTEGKLAAITQYISNELKQRQGLFDDRVEEIAAPNWDHISTFVLTEESIVFIYQPYEVGPFVAGAVEVEILMKDFEEL